MKRTFTLLCAALFITGLVQGHVYSEQETAQLLELLNAPRQDCQSKEEALPLIREMVAQFIKLIENGANPNIIHPDGREFPLLTSVVILDFFGIIAQTADQSSCVQSHLTKEEVQEFTTAVYDITELLLEHGADPNTCNNNSSPTLFCAYSPEIAKLLIDYGADRSLQDNQGQTALQAFETQRLGLLENIAQGKESGFPFVLSIEAQRNLVTHIEAVIEVLKTYRIN